MPAASQGYIRLVQQDLSGGMFPAVAPELIPPNGVFDITNGLLNEQNVCYERGGSTYLTKQAAGATRMLWSGYLKHGGLQTILCTDAGSFRVEADGTLHAIEELAAPSVLSPGVVFQGRLYVPGSGSTHVWDGETVSGDSRPNPSPFYAVAGNRLIVGSGSRVSVSKVPAKEGDAVSWEEETNYLSLPEGVSITGMAAWRTSVVVFTTRGIWLISGLNHDEITDATGNIQWSQDLYSPDAVLWGAAGVASWKGGLVVPCRDDVWLMELGVSSEKSTPFRSISEPIENPYREYVAKGFMPGSATVFNGHYFLPILNGTTVVDMLVCRLAGVNSAGKSESAWTHLTGYGAELAAITGAISDLEGPLIGATASDSRLLTLSYFTPNANVATDADGSNHNLSITYRDIQTGNLVPNLVGKARVSYRMKGAGSHIEDVGGTQWGAFNWGEADWGIEGTEELVNMDEPTLHLEVGDSAFAGAEWGEFDWGEDDWTSGDTFRVLEAVAPPDPEALKPFTCRVGLKVRYCRMRLSIQGQAANVSIRALELFVREDGRIV